MKYLWGIIAYIGIGCAYQSTYDDVNVRELVSADVPVSFLGHIFAWPYVILYHAIGFIGWGLGCLMALVCIALFGLWIKEKIQDRARRIRLQTRRARA